MGASGTENLMAEAFALVRQGKLVDAERLFVQLCQQNAENDKAWFMRGVIRVEHGDTNRAIEYLRTAVRLDPANIQAHFTLCKLYLSRGNLAEAIAQAGTVVELDAEHGEAWLALGSLYADAGLLQEAEQASRTAIRLLPGVAEPKINLVNALISQQQQDEAVALCKSIEQDGPAHAGIWHSLGLAFKALGQIPEAENCLTRTIRLEPNNAAAYCALGEIKAAKEEVSQALGLYRKSRELNPACPRVHFELGKVLLPSNSARHWRLVEQVQQDHRYHDIDEACDIAKELAKDFQYGDTAVDQALVRFFDEYDPSQLYPVEWWTDALMQFGDRRQASDTALRSIYSTVYSWSLPCRQALDEIAAFAGKRLASFGSGTAYWEYLLARYYGIEVSCHDMMLRHRFTSMKKVLHSEATIDLEDTIFFAWLPAEAADSSIERLLNQIGAGQKLVLVGEPADDNGQPRSCGTRRFFQYLRDNFKTRAIIALANYAYFEDRVELLVRE